MGDEVRKGRGISRGRASRGRQTVSGQQERPPGQSTVQHGVPPQGAWARRPGAPTAQAAPPAQQQYAVASTSAQPPQQQVVAMPPQQQKAYPTSSSASGGGDASASLGRGAMRGRRVLNIAELLRTRPATTLTKQGKTGRPVQLMANYFKILTATDWCLYKYRVDFAPEEDRMFARKGLLSLHRQAIGPYIFEGTVLYTSTRLPQPMEVYSERKSDGQKIQITIRLTGDMVKGDEHYLQFYNIIMRKCLQLLELQLVGRNYFDARAKVAVPRYNLELWPGYVTSIRQHETDILMSAEISHKVMRQQTLLDMLNECYNKYSNNYQNVYKSLVIGVTVLTAYNNRTYRIDDVDFSNSPNATFMKKNESVSYRDYYKQKYQIEIRQPNQPMLISKSKERDRRAGAQEFVCLVPELCMPTGLTDEMRSDNTMMRNLADYTRIDPRGRITRLMAFNRRLHTTDAIVQEFQNWNLRLDKQLLPVPGRILDPEVIYFGGDKSASAGREADWTRSLKVQPMMMSTKLSNWVVITPNRLARDTDRFLDTLKSSVSAMNFPLMEPRKYPLQDDRPGGYTSAIEEIMSRDNPQLIFCVLMNNRGDRYAAIKKKCCVDRPVPTQCMTTRIFNAKNVMSIATKIAIQMNCKIGGAPWAVKIPVSGLMVAGFDVCHDTGSKQHDFGALVASLNNTYSRYYSAVSAHTTGEELSNYLAVNMCKAVQKYREVNNALPTRIVFYRDGVGEGQIPFVHEHEVERIKAKLAEVYGGPEHLHMAYIIVTKRLNTRLFFERENNPPPGTVVDDVITSPLKYDFFIVSQHVMKGSVSPTGYNVISDNVGLDASKLQLLTYKLTHMYFNCSNTVRVPAPCQFAHKLAFLVSQSIHAVPSNHLDTILYFL